MLNYHFLPFVNGGFHGVYYTNSGKDIGSYCVKINCFFLFNANDTNQLSD